ncbi:MAG: hypothetical protein JSS02_11070 [Planctomycetes bacterium]|nr:hypothetical protein [Planctomycetota bacterium]
MSQSISRFTGLDTRRTLRSAASKLVLAAWVALTLAEVSQAGVTGFYGVLRQDEYYQQTANGSAVFDSSRGYEINFLAFSENYTDVSLSGGGAAFHLYEYTSETGYSFNSRSDLRDFIPSTTYVLQATNQDGTDFADVFYSYSDDNFPQTIPFLSGTDYSALQGMNPSNPFTFHFSPFVPGSAAESSEIELAIFDMTGHAANITFYTPGTTEVTFNGGQFTPGHHYRYALTYDGQNRLPTTDLDGEMWANFSYTTIGEFTTASQTAAVPEPSSFLAVAALALTLPWISRRRRSSRPSTVGAGSPESLSRG